MSIHSLVYVQEACHKSKPSDYQLSNFLLVSDTEHLVFVSEHPKRTLLHISALYLHKMTELSDPSISKNDNPLIQRSMTLSPN